MSVMNDDSLEGQGYEGYINRYGQGKPIENDSNVPISIIRSYLQSNITLKSSEKIYKNFKAEYILLRNKSIPASKAGVKDINLNKHSKGENLGLADVYDYISKYNFESECNFSIYELLNLHKILFSHTPFPEYAGLYRNTAAGVSKCDLEFIDYTHISTEINELSYEFKKITKKTACFEKYIISSIGLYAKLFNILPFSDGNGRTITALFNLLLKYVGLPPIYIKHEEKDKYCEALQIAILENDTKELEQFFLFKIANAIIENDVEYSGEAVKIMQIK